MSRAATTAATRQAVIAAARELLSTEDWRRFTVEAVGVRAGVTRVTVYNQVGSKDGLLDAVLTDLTERAGMDRLVSGARHRPEPLAWVVGRTCRFWHAERAVLRPLFGLAATDRPLAANLARREGWRRAQFTELVTGSPDALAGIVAVTSFPAYDALGDLARHPGRAAAVVLRMVRALLD
jgi:AcrR family transcriptional regulator